MHFLEADNSKPRRATRNPAFRNQCRVALGERRRCFRVLLRGLAFGGKVVRGSWEGRTCSARDFLAGTEDTKVIISLDGVGSARRVIRTADFFVTRHGRTLAQIMEECGWS